MRPIDADALEDMGYELQRTYQKDANTMVYEVKKIADVPTVEAEPIRHGQWIVVEDIGDCCYRCSNCGFIRDAYVLDVGKYCPSCGARMEEQE